MCIFSHAPECTIFQVSSPVSKNFFLCFRCTGTQNAHALKEVQPTLGPVPMAAHLYMAIFSSVHSLLFAKPLPLCQKLLFLSGKCRKKCFYCCWERGVCKVDQIGICFWEFSFDLHPFIMMNFSSQKLVTC